MKPHAEDLVGHILLGKLEVVKKLGGGGMGVVYEVEHRLTGHRRALKVVHAKFADRPRFMKRLLREAKVAGTLSSPYVVETYDAGRLEDGSAYVLMELLHGRSLYELLQAEGRIASRRLAEIMCQVAEGMSVAHEAGIVHRDLKPENIFLVSEPDGGERVKILDFGVSKFESTNDQPTRLTVEGTLVGTPYYMSPEQAAGRAVDARSDVYAMGVMLYEALAGRLPFEADTVGALFVKIGSGECVPLRIRRPELEDAWYELVHKAFHRDPEQRHQSSEALRRDLLPLVGGGATAARARTISDGARATLGYSAELPPPPKTPSDLQDELTDENTAEAEEDEAIAFAPPPPERTSAQRGGMPVWGWALLGAALVALLVAVPWRLLGGRDGGEREASAPRQQELPRERGSRDPELDAPAPNEEEDRAEPTSAADAGANLATPPVKRDRNRARAAGLDPNPYRR
jgi:eukaryotic-like serine/threonine-protein kinase